MARLWKLMKSLHVEPVLFLVFLSNTSYSVGIATLISQKVCFPEGPPGIDAICQNDQALMETAELNQVKGMLRAFIPAVVVIFAGSWKDVTNRLLPILIISHVGEMIATGLELASSFFWNVSPFVFLVMDCCIGSLGGSSSTITMCGMSYITEKSTPEERAIRMPIMMVATMGGVCISLTFAGMLLTYLDYKFFFIAILVTYGTSLLLAILLVKDTPSNTSSGGYLESAKRLKIVFHSRPNTFQIWSFIIAISLITSMLSAESSVSYLFLQKKFQTPPSTAGLLGGYKMFISLITGGIATPLMKHWLNLSDFLISAICVVPSVISCFGMAFAENMDQIYIFATLDLLRITLIATLINLFTGCLKKSEIGIFTSSLSFAEGVLPLALSPLYVYVFQKTVDSMPGAFYCISGCSLILSGLLIWVISFSYKVYEEPADEGHLSKDNSTTREGFGGVNNLVFSTERT